MEGKPLYRTLATIGFASVAVAVLIIAAISTSEDRGFFFVVAAVAVLAAVLINKLPKGGQWVSLVASVLVLMGTWWMIFPVLQGFALSALDFGPSLLGFLGGWTALVSSILGVAKSRRDRQFSEGTRKKVLSVGVVAVVLIVASSVLTVTGKDTVSAADKAGTTLISMKSNKFAPVTVTLPSGTTKLLLRNDDPFAHTFTIEKDYDVEEVFGPGDEKVISFMPKAAGSIEFICDFHSDMKGTITVS